MAKAVNVLWDYGPGHRSFSISLFVCSLALTLTASCKLLLSLLNLLFGHQVLEHA